MENLEIKKTYSVGGKDYETKEEALKAMAMEVLHSEIPKGFDSVVANASKIISALKIINK